MTKRPTLLLALLSLLLFTVSADAFSPKDLVKWKKNSRVEDDECELVTKD